MNASILQEFSDHLAEFGEGLDKLHRMMGDVNEATAPILVEEIHAETLAVMGLQVAALEAARQAQRSIEQHKDHAKTLQQLGSCNQSFIEMLARFYKHLYTADHIVNLEKLKRKQAGEWAVITVNDMDSCHQGMQEICRLLLNCWRAAAESITSHSALVQTTSIGQQFLVSERNK